MNLQLPRPLGRMRVIIDPTWPLILLLVMISLARNYLPRAMPRLPGPAAWILGGAASLLLFVSVLAHEVSHALLLRRAGIRVPRIRLLVFGGVSELAAELHEPCAEARIALAGTVTSLALAVLAWGLARALTGPSGALRFLLEFLAFSNLALGLFNLLPGLPLDGGRVLRAWLWSRHGNLMRATRTAGQAGVALGALLIGVGLVSLVLRGYVTGLWLILIGIFLQRAAFVSYEMRLLRDLLSGVQVRQVMVREIDTVPDHMSVQDLVREHFLSQTHGVLPVTSGDRFAGMVSTEQVRRVPREEWIRTPVRLVMTPAASLAPISPHDECIPVLERMIREEASPLPVVVDGRVVGILSRGDLLKVYRIQAALARN